MNKEKISLDTQVTSGMVAKIVRSKNDEIEKVLESKGLSTTDPKVLRRISSTVEEDFYGEEFILLDNKVILKFSPIQLTHEFCEDTLSYKLNSSFYVTKY